MFAKKRLNISRNATIDVLVVVVVALFSLFVWRQLPSLAVRGDGFVYLVARTQDAFWRFPQLLGGLEVGSISLSKSITPIFRTNMSLYWWLVLVTLIVINVLFYFLVRSLTKNYYIGFLASLMLAVNYFGNWEMYAGGIYAYFMERVPNMLFLLPSFLFLHLFLETKKNKFYILSLLLFFLGVGIWHWSLLFSGPYLIYPIFWNLFNGAKGSIVKGIVLATPYFLLTIFFFGLQRLTQGGLGPTWSFLEYLLHPKTYQYPRLMLRELVYWSEYTPLLKGFLQSPLRYVNSPINYLMNPNEAIAITSNVVIVYIAGFVVSFVKLPKMRPLLLTAVLGTASIFYLNSYLGQYIIESQPGSNRYLYLPTFLLVIFWSLFAWAIYFGSKLWRGLVIFSLILYFLANYSLVSTHMSWILPRHAVSRKVWDYLISERGKLESGTTVVIPNSELGSYEAEFLTDQLGKDELIYISDVEGWEELAYQATGVVRVKYDKGCDCVVSEKLK